MASIQNSPAVAPAIQHEVQRKEFNDEKAHYKSLIELFKYVIGILTLLFAAIGFGLGYITYNNGQDMRNGLKDEKKAMEENIGLMKADLKSQKDDLQTKEDDLKTRVDALILNTSSIIDNTKIQTVAQLSSIKTMAIDEARNRIDQVFRDRNFDQFVENIAKQRMEPQIQNIVDQKIKAIEKANNMKVDQAVDDLLSLNPDKSIMAMQFLLFNPLQQLTESQTEKLIQAIKKGNPDTKSNLMEILKGKNSQTGEKFLKSIALNQFEKIDYPIGNIFIDAITYFISPFREQNLAFYYDVVNKSDDKWTTFNILIQHSGRNNITLFNQLLNDKKVVNIATQAFDNTQLEVSRNDLVRYMENDLKISLPKDSYFMLLHK